MALEKWLKSHPDFELVTRDGISRVVCSLNGHELQTRVEDLVAYIKSKSYIKASQFAYDYSKYLPHIVPTSDSTKLQCNLTKRVINKTPEQVEAHIRGQRYQKLLKEWEAEQQAMQEDAFQNGSLNDNGEPEEELWLPQGESDHDDEEEGEEEEEPIANDVMDEDTNDNHEHEHEEDLLEDIEQNDNVVHQKSSNGKKKKTLNGTSHSSNGSPSKLAKTVQHASKIKAPATKRVIKNQQGSVPNKRQKSSAK